jgi:hypothetical protein
VRGGRQSGLQPATPNFFPRSKGQTHYRRSHHMESEGHRVHVSSSSLVINIVKHIYIYRILLKSKILGEKHITNALELGLICVGDHN